MGGIRAAMPVFHHEGGRRNATGGANAMSDKDRLWLPSTAACQMASGEAKEIGHLKPGDKVIVRGNTCVVVSVVSRDVHGFPEVKVMTEPMV